MGLYDDLTVECVLPDGFDPAGHTFQTKDTGEQYLAHYVLREDGSFFNSKSGEIEQHHGTLHFYTSNWAGSCGNLEMTTDDAPPWSAAYTALFDRGRLLKIDAAPGYSLETEVEHVLRADFHGRCEELRKARAKPGDDLRSEWMSWMVRGESPRNDEGGFLAAARLPARQLRLSYLRGHCAWGMRTADDSVEDLRNWSAWLASDGDLTAGERDMLDRTLAFLAGVAP